MNADWNDPSRAARLRHQEANQVRFVRLLADSHGESTLARKLEAFEDALRSAGLERRGE